MRIWPRPWLALTCFVLSFGGTAVAVASPHIGQMTISDGAVPRYGKLEITFQVDTTAKNPQFPFDVSPPGGIPPSTGISVDALFTPDNWKTVHKIPAFFYQEFQDEVRSGREWFYPTGNHCWKVRFSPPDSGSWEFRITATDATGFAESAVHAFEVVPSANRGFVRVSAKDIRYFEYADGSYFPGLGYNMRFDELSWRNPVLDNRAQFRAMKENGIQLIRFWLSQWGISGSEWNPWSAQDPGLHGQYLPHTGITFEEAVPESEVSMKIDGAGSPCMFIGAWKAPPAVKRETQYRVRVRYKAREIVGPRIEGKPFGFVAKTGDWLWGDGGYCHDAGTGTPITERRPTATSEWEISEGLWASGDKDFLPNFFLALENVKSGSVWIDYVWIEEDLGNGQFGPNIVSKPWMAHHQYFEQRNSYAFDKLLSLAEEHEVLLRPVLHEKNDRLLSAFDFAGNPAAPDNGWFYGNFRSMTKSRWLQKAFWRYAQARWGYSQSIHSWELLNEGDPFDGRHYALADEFGKYMQCQVFGIEVGSEAGEKCEARGVNAHMVSTSFWHSFPSLEFWSDWNYPNVSFADIHKYVGEDSSGFADTALATFTEGAAIGAKQEKGAGKPVIRGETGFVVSDSGEPNQQILRDQDGIWLHDFIWGGLHAGGIIESYWYANPHIYNSATGVDHRHHFVPFFTFVSTLPLNNGRYEDLDADISNPDLRVLGQKDTDGGKAHFWIQNRWRNWLTVIEKKVPEPVNGTIRIAGFQPEQTIQLDWWDTWTADPDRRILRSEQTRTDSNGILQVDIVDFTLDLAVKVSVVSTSELQ